MTWTVITDEGGEREGRLSPLDTRDLALDFAKAVTEFSVKVVRLESTDGYSEPYDPGLRQAV